MDRYCARMAKSVSADLWVGVGDIIDFFFLPGPAVSKWCDAAFEGARMLVGHDLQVAKHYKEWLTEVGCKHTRHFSPYLMHHRLMLSR